jgi:hypothetical protein
MLATTVIVLFVLLIKSVFTTGGYYFGEVMCFDVRCVVVDT